MNAVGERSFCPSKFSVYKSGIDVSQVNVWKVFERRLPCQLALLCHDAPKTVGELSTETGTPAVYIEDELLLLENAGVMVRFAKDKYRTNFFILDAEAAAELARLFKDLYAAYVPSVCAAYAKFLPELKDCGVFRFDASDRQWAWFFADKIADFDWRGCALSAEDYPRILSCGSRAFVYAEEADPLLWSAGHTPVRLEKCTVWPCDVNIFGPYHCQRELGSPQKAQALYDVYTGAVRDEDVAIYAELLAQGYLVKRGAELFCNIPVLTASCRSLFERINAGLQDALQSACGGVRADIERMVQARIPEQLRPYTKGYAQTLIAFYAGINLYESLYQAGFLTLPDSGDPVPLACYIHEE